MRFGHALAEQPVCADHRAARPRMILDQQMVAQHVIGIDVAAAAAGLPLRAHAAKETS